MRRKPGQLVPLEVSILSAVAHLEARGFESVHGFQIGKYLADTEGRAQLTAFGTLYRALARLEAMGLMESKWENPSTAASDRRPVRRLYTVTAPALQILRAAEREARHARGTKAPRKGVAPA